MIGNVVVRVSKEKKVQKKVLDIQNKRKVFIPRRLLLKLEDYAFILTLLDRDAFGGLIQLAFLT